LTSTQTAKTNKQEKRKKYRELVFSHQQLLKHTAYYQHSLIQELVPKMSGLTVCNLLTTVKR
jgi:hypothetical protein